MQNETTSHERPEDAGVTPRQGNTVPAQGETQSRVPRMPHERDESADSQSAQEPSSQRVGKQGQKDVARGLVDTGTGPALGQAYDKVRR